MSDLPAAGWYPDPETAGQERWWNGTAWADDRRPVQIAPPPPQPYQQAPYGYVAAQPRRNGLATTGIVLSLISLLLNPFSVLSILGIIFGAVGLGRSKETVVDGKQIGRSAALWAIWLGIISTIWFVVQWQIAMSELERALNSF